MKVFVKHYTGGYGGGCVIVAASTKKIAEKRVAKKGIDNWCSFDEAKVIPGVSYNGARGKILVSDYYIE